jgi:lysyl-tRNA synthetase, class II
MLIVGFSRVFEIGSVFRNEGLSVMHNFEFTVLEAYVSFTNYKALLKVIYCLVCYLFLKMFGDNILFLEYQKVPVLIFGV